MRRGREGAAIAYHIVVTVLLILRASAIFSTPISPISLSPNLIQRQREREMRRGRKGAAIAYFIVVTVLFIFRASAIFSAPMGPILIFLKLIQR
jgi:type IV secretory pathway VirB2 component (pilin)